MVRVEVDGHTIIITLDRPEVRNAVNGELSRGVEAAIDRLEDEEDLWVGILAAEGPVFCAGADLKEISEGRGATIGTPRGGLMGVVRRERTKPLIAAVDGPAFAGGCEAVLACDLVVASKRAAFGLPEAKRSLVAGAGGLFRLSQELPKNIALELSMTGDGLDAERAYQLGMVNRLTESGEVLEAAKELANAINANAPMAVRAARAVVLATDPLDEQKGWAVSAQKSHEIAQTEDYLEGPKAFLEKRAPQWKGR